MELRVGHPRAELAVLEVARGGVDVDEGVAEQGAGGARLAKLGDAVAEGFRKAVRLGHRLDQALDAGEDQPWRLGAAEVFEQPNAVAEDFVMDHMSYPNEIRMRCKLLEVGVYNTTAFVDRI